MTRSAEVREQLVEALRLDLVGPAPDRPGQAEPHAHELLDTAPSRFYLTGFIIPYESKHEDRADEFVADELDEQGRNGDEEEDDRVSTRRGSFPSSMGVTLLVPSNISQLRAVVSWGDYVPENPPAPQDAVAAGGHAIFGRWQRKPRQESVIVDVQAREPIEIPRSQGLKLVVATRPVDDGAALSERAAAVSLYVVNQRPAREGLQRDTAIAFQVALTVECLQSFVARSNPRGFVDPDPDEQTAAIQYRDVVQYGVGHNVAVESQIQQGQCRSVSTQWIPRAPVFKLDHNPLVELNPKMLFLGSADRDAAAAALRPLLLHFAAHLDGQQHQLGQLDPRHHPHGRNMIATARRIHQRLELGLDQLGDPQILRAFQIANRVMAAAAQRRQGIQAEVAPETLNAWIQEQARPPSWRPFQIAFLLMNLAGLSDPQHPDRQTVDLLFFPTGGGKTEAYLALAAFTLALRRLRKPGPEGGGLTVLMRYTLRLLTLDQMDRAAALICALEHERLHGPDAEALGERPFEIGLWVGMSATPNRLGKSGERDPHSARFKLKKYKEDPKRFDPPVPLQACPWCGQPFLPASFELVPDANNPSDLRIFCQNRACAFRQSQSPQGLPIVTIDEVIYRRLPCFLIATADKFAGLPWLAESGQLFGQVSRHHKHDYIGSEGGRLGTRLAAALAPPDLIIQDELHLISGPLGTMVGLYETAVEALMGAHVDYLPKIIASTATVRRAQKQIKGLFGRDHVEVFPPPGLDHTDNFFAQADPEPEHARLYLGVAAPGRSLKVVLMRTYLALLASAQKQWLAEGGDGNPNNPVDPYMTLLGYFSALRELGGSRRIVEDEIAKRLTTYAERKRVGSASGSFANRPRLRLPVELTSRESTQKVAQGKKRLALQRHDENSVDVALATNMISVGLDISRLGLMVVLGQPKTTAEYIQATSRVGRDDARPGLVLTLLNVHRPRDRSHFENFAYWHSCFYRSVEVNSVTPFSARALDRGLAAVVVALARHLQTELTPTAAAGRIAEFRVALTERIAALVCTRAQNSTARSVGESLALTRYLERRISHLLQTWEQLASDHELAYQTRSGANALLHPAGRKDANNLSFEEEQFKIQWSLREVEPAVNLWLKYPKGYGKENS